jgi:hypothetical protein
MQFKNFYFDDVTIAYMKPTATTVSIVIVKPGPLHVPTSSSGYLPLLHATVNIFFNFPESKSHRHAVENTYYDVQRVELCAHGEVISIDVCDGTVTKPSDLSPPIFHFGSAWRNRPEVAAFVFAPACSGKTTFSRKCIFFVDIDDLYAPEKKYLKVLRRAALESQDWSRHNMMMNATVFKTFYRSNRYSAQEYVILCHHPDQVKGFYRYDADTAVKHILILNRCEAERRLNASHADTLRKKMAVLNTRELLNYSRRDEFTVVNDLVYERYLPLLRHNDFDPFHDRDESFSDLSEYDDSSEDEEESRPTKVAKRGLDDMLLEAYQNASEAERESWAEELDFEVGSNYGQRLHET